MKTWGYVVAAYSGAGLLYGGYVIRLVIQERRLERRRRGRSG